MIDMINLFWLLHDNANPEAVLVEAAPDLVGVTDVANLLGCTRQNIQK